MPKVKILVRKRSKSKRSKSKRVKSKTIRRRQRKSKVVQETFKNLEKYVSSKKEKNESCMIMTPHGEKIELPNKYPGDYYVFQYLYPNPEDNMELVDPQVFKDIYNKYHKMCF